MRLTPGINNSRDLFQKLKRDADRLKKEGSSNADAMFDFVVTAHHLKEWIKQDNTMPREAKRQLSAVERTPQLRMCADIANASKHFLRVPRNAYIRGVRSLRGLGIGRIGTGPIGHGEQVITIELDTGKVIHALNFCMEVLELYRPLFEVSE